MRSLRATCAVVLFGSATVVFAQAYPAKPVRMLHGFTAGGAVDITARLIAGPMAELLGQQVIVDGRPGAGGTTAAALIARTEPDGYTLFLMASGHATSSALYRSLPYDAARDFTLISMVAANPFVLAVHPSFPARTTRDLVRMAKAAPGKIDYGTGGIGTGMHLASVLFQSRAGIRLNHVPYKGGNAAPVALLTGEIPLIFNTPAGVEGHVAGGRIRILAITTKSRFELWPDVPTIAESAVPDFDVRGWYAVAAPRNMARSLIDRLNEAVQSTLKRSDVKGRFLSQGSEVTPTTAEEAQRFVAGEVARWTKVVKDENIPPQN